MKGHTTSGLGSGFSNTATGGSAFDGYTSGFFNQGVTGPIFGFPSGTESGFNSGFENMGTAIASVFGILRG
jgi:hypothetical protein